MSRREVDVVNLFPLLPLLLPAFCLAPAVAADKPAAVVAPARKPDPYVLLPEPRAMRSLISHPLGGARLTVFSPVKASADGELSPYSVEEFNKLGISWESFLERSRAAADRRLAALQPELIKDPAGKLRYAVYRGAEPVYASLLLAPSLARVFEKVFGGEVWLAAPDRHALYVFPADAAALVAVAADLEERFESNAYSASEEIFHLNREGELRSVGQFTSR